MRHLGCSICSPGALAAASIDRASKVGVCILGGAPGKGSCRLRSCEQPDFCFCNAAPGLGNERLKEVWGRVPAALVLGSGFSRPDLDCAGRFARRAECFFATPVPQLRKRFPARRGPFSVACRELRAPGVATESCRAARAGGRPFGILRPIRAVGFRYIIFGYSRWNICLVHHARSYSSNGLMRKKWQRSPTAFGSD